MKRYKYFAVVFLFALLSVTLPGCSDETEPEESVTPILPPVSAETEEETADLSTEMKVVYRTNYTFSGTKIPKTVSDEQYLPTETEGEAEEGKIVYAVNNKKAGRLEGWKTQDAGEESREITAVAKLGYKFVCWSDGVKTASRSGDTEAGVYTAIFDYDVLDMPIVVINTVEGAEINSKEEYTDATFSVLGCDKKYIINDMSMQIRGRGNNSWSYPKKSYKFKLEEKANLLGIADGKDRGWVLLANQCDQSLIRNNTAFELGRYFEGIDWMPSSTSVEVYLNGEYIGVYLLAEDIKISKNRVNISEENPEELDTGYLLELSNYAEGEVISAAGRVYMVHNELSEDKNVRNKQKKYIKDYVNDAFDALSSGDYERTAELIDIDSLVATYLTEEIVENLDTQWDSFYLYKDVGGKLFFGPLWDFDLSLGNADDGSESYEGLFVGNGRGSGGGPLTWYAVAMTNEWFRQLVQDKWLEIYPSVCEMPRFVRNNAESGFRSYERNFEKWQIFGIKQNRETVNITSLKSYAEHYEYLVSWLEKRIEWLDGAFRDEEFVSEGRGLSQRGN